jgi:putative membrane protein
MTLFAIVGLLSVYPTRVFLSWRAVLKQGVVPALDDVARRRIARVIHTELTGIALIILCAVLMARGIGYFG